MLFINLHPSVFAGNSPDSAHSSLVATSPGSAQVPADGSTQASLTLTLKDSFGTPLAGDTVSLSATNDGTIVFSPTSITLDASGIATFSATSTTVGTAILTVTDASTSSDLVGLGKAIFDPVPTATPTAVPTSTPGPPSCSYAYPTEAPNLYQVSSSSGSAYLWFVEPISQFDGYTISYGLTQDAESYNYTFKQGRVGAALEYTINDLTPGSLYYFKIRANNGCAPGPWSNVLNSNNSIVSGTLPATGPGNLFTVLGIGGVGLATLGILTFLFVL